jgi:L-amino acid N-acyltransferase YncA
VDKLVETLINSYPKKVVLEDGSEVIFRPLRKDDEVALATFFGDLPLKDRACLKEDVSDPRVIQSWIDRLDYDAILPIIATENDRIVGDATLHFNPTRWTHHQAEIRLTTGVSHRAKRLGKQLTQDVMDIAQKLGLEQLSIELAPELQEAFLLCQKLGFTQAAVLKGFIVDLDGVERDLVLMIKQLKDSTR